MIEPRDTYIDPLLSNVALNYRPKGFIADMVFPIVPVPTQGGYYQVVEKADTFRLPGNTVRAPGTKARQTDFRIGSAQYYAENYALGGFFTLEEIENPNLGPNYQNGKVQFTTGQLLNDYDARVSAQALLTTNVGCYGTPSSLWSDLNDGNSNPIEDLKAGIDAVELGTGYRPNRGIIGGDVWNALRFHETIRKMIFPHGGGVPELNQVAGILELEQLLIGRSAKNSTEDDSTTFTPVQHWGGSMVLYYAPSGPSITEPSWGYSFRWTPGNKVPFAVRRFPYKEETDSAEYDVQYYQDEVITDANLAYMVQSAI